MLVAVGGCALVGWCRQREKIDWQEPSKFDCWLVRTIFIFVNFYKKLYLKIGIRVRLPSCWAGTT